MLRETSYCNQPNYAIRHSRVRQLLPAIGQVLSQKDTSPKIPPRFSAILPSKMKQLLALLLCSSLAASSAAQSRPPMRKDSATIRGRGSDTAFKTLKAVTVRRRKPLIEERIDRTVYNVEGDLTILGGDATDALRRVPLLSVDIDGNVTLRGSSNFKVLINGKPSTITADNLAAALKQIPVDQIKSVEVITAPSAKYDADGSAGIINIVLKQDRLKGVILNPDMAIGTRASFLGLNGGYNNRKMGFSVGGFGRAAYNVTGTYNNFQEVGTASIDQKAGIRKNEISGNYNSGWDYDMDKNNFMSASFRYSVLNNHTDQDNLLTAFYEGAILDSTQLNQVQTTNRSGTVDLSLDYTHSFARPRREFSLLALYSHTNRTNGFTNVQQDPDNDTLIGRWKNVDANSNQEITFQADYQTPVDSAQLFEIGAKYIIRDVISNYNYMSAVGSEALSPEQSPALTNQFDYHQNVTAAYLEYTWSPRSVYSLRAGARYEYTSISAHLRDPDTAITGIPSYGVLVPSLNLARRLKNGKLIKLAYARRIQRPSIQYLNPNFVASNPGNISTGNPALGTEHTDNVELAYNTTVGALALGFAGFYRHTTQAIETVSEPVHNGDTIERTFANIGKESTWGINSFGNLDIGEKLSLSGGADLYYTTLVNAPPSADSADASLAGHNKGWIFAARLSGGYTFRKGWTIYLYSYYRSRQVLLQGFQTGYPYYSLTLKRDLPNKRGTIGLGAENFLGPGIAVKDYVTTSSLNQSTTTVTHTLSLRVYASFRFGKLKVEKAARNKKSITNDDLKQD
jgi:outer membrane receptor protein involved in Fe transport